MTDSLTNLAHEFAKLTTAPESTNFLWQLLSQSSDTLGESHETQYYGIYVSYKLRFNGQQRQNFIAHTFTGSSTGFGRAMVEEILHNGDIAVATLRKSPRPRRHRGRGPIPAHTAPSAPTRCDKQGASQTCLHTSQRYLRTRRRRVRQCRTGNLSGGRGTLTGIDYWGAVTVNLEVGGSKIIQRKEPKGTIKGSAMIGYL